MQDRPTASELLRAARDFCEEDLLPELEGRLRFHTRVLANVLQILEREWDGEEDALRHELERLRVLLGEEGLSPTSGRDIAERVRHGNTELARRIRAGEMDEHLEETIEAVYASVVEKLAIANPGYASSET